MAEIVNLRRAKKRKAREAVEKTAAANRAMFGTPRSLRAAARLEEERAARVLDSGKIEKD